MAVLVLPIKRKWFDMILSGEKKEEYRSCSQYWLTRFCNLGLLERGPGGNYTNCVGIKKMVKFRNGYSYRSPYFVAKVRAFIGPGNPAWGAKQGETYIVLAIIEIMRGGRMMDKASDVERSGGDNND